MSATKLDEKDAATIADFGEQWTRYPDNGGYYGSPELFLDFTGPLLSREELRAARVADIGSGSGRIVNMLLDLGAERVVAVEPSAAFAVLKENTRARAERIDYLNVAGDRLPAYGDLDLVVSLGVLHHIHDPGPTVAAALAALKPGGRCLIWVYGTEGNEAYLALAEPLRRLTTRLPHAALATLVRALDFALVPYIALARLLPLPLRRYCRSVLAKLAPDKRRLVIYDQLRPAYARYYRRDEARDLLQDQGFADVRLHHRHGTGWTVSGARPLGGSA